MDLSRITSYAFYEMYSEVRRNLNDPERFKDTLDEARRELPLVDGMLGHLSEVHEMPEGSERESLFNRVMHDINIIIALWKIEQQESATKPQPEIESDDTPVSNQLRLRGYGIN